MKASAALAVCSALSIGSPFASDSVGAPSDAAPQWLPLGVYELSPTVGALAAQSVQLAVDKNGDLRGVYFDQLTGATQNIVGRVDASTQAAVWSLESNPAVRFSTTLNDLTQPNGKVTLTLPGGQQSWTLTRAGA